MTGNHLRAAAINSNLDEKNADPRTPHSIRFSDSEWSRSEQAAKGRGMTAAELVRHAARWMLAPTRCGMRLRLGKPNL